MRNEKQENDDSKKKRKDFFMVPNELIKSGLWARMKPSVRAVYQVLCYFSHPNSGLAYPSIKKISELSGCKKDTVCAATKQLCIYGLISKKLAPAGFKFRMTYRVIKEPKIEPITIPWKREKCSPKKDKKTGKFIKSPSKRESDTFPLKGGSDTIPSSREQNHNNKDISILTLKEKHKFTKHGHKKMQKKSAIRRPRSFRLRRVLFFDLLQFRNKIVDR